MQWYTCHITLEFFLISWFSGLKGGGGGGGGGASDGQGSTFTYTFHGDPHATFATFFGGTNPFEMFFGRKVITKTDIIYVANFIHAKIPRCFAWGERREKEIIRTNRNDAVKLTIKLVTLGSSRGISELNCTTLTIIKMTHGRDDGEEDEHLDLHLNV